MKSIAVIITGFAFMFNINLLFAQTDNSNYQISDRIQLEGDGGWDLLTVDETTGELFVSHSTMVQVIDTKTNKLIGSIPDLNGVHGIALAPDLNKGFTSNGKDSSVTVFNMKTLEVIEKVNVTGRNPDVIIYDQFSNSVFVFNAAGNNVTVIDASSDQVTGTITLQGNPEFAATDDNGNIFVNIEDKSMIDEIDSKTLDITQQWSIAPGEEPSGLAIDAVNNRLFSVCHNNLMVILDSKSGSIITTLPIGDHVDGAAFDPVLKRAYSSNGDGTLTVIQEENENTFTVLENVITQKGARTMALDSKTGNVYLPTAELLPPPDATPDNPNPRPGIKPGTFVVLQVSPVK